MENLSISCRITKAGLGTIKFGTYVYNIVEVEIANMTDFKAFVPYWAELGEGDSFKSDKWYITRFEREDDNPTHLAIRVDNMTITEEYEPQKHFMCMVSGRFLTSDRCHITTAGPTQKALYRCTLRLKDEDGGTFTVLLSGFQDVALQMSTTPRFSIIQGIACVKPKKYSTGYELCLSEFEIINNKDKEK